jgi:HAE1 family hydrophobic/amphiphilic exporter-1
MLNVKASTGTRIEITAQDIHNVESIIRRIVDKNDLDVIVSNIGVTPGFSAIYTTNTGSHSAFVLVNLKEHHKIGSYEYMNRVRAAIHKELPELTTYFQTGGLVDAVLNMGLPAPIDIQITGSNLEDSYSTAADIAGKIAALPGVSDVFIPQDIDAPSLRVDVNRQQAVIRGLSQKEVVSNVITALTSNMMIAPSYWVDPNSGNDYMLTVQYPEKAVATIDDLKSIPVRASREGQTSRLDTIADLTPMLASTVVNHYQLQRVVDIYVAPSGENLRVIGPKIQNIIDHTHLPENIRIAVRGSINAMHASFNSFGLGLLLAVLLVYLILVAQFKSFIDPFIILLAVPPGITGTIIVLIATGTTLNVMSLMGTVMMVGIVVSNSILIVEFAHHLLRDGMDVKQAVTTSCRIRLRPVLMTSLATIIGLIPMALALGAGSEAYASLARVIIGGLTVSVLLTIFLVPAAFLLVYRRHDRDLHRQPQSPVGEGHA